LTSTSAIFSIYEKTLILKIIDQSDIKHIMTLPIKTKTSVLKVLIHIITSIAAPPITHIITSIVAPPITHIITSIVAPPITHTVILVIMFV
jgi:hypothetical protein